MFCDCVTLAMENTVFLVVLLCGMIIGYVVRWLKLHAYRHFEEADERRRTYKGPTRIIPSNITHCEKWAPNVEGQLLFQQQFIPDDFVAVIVVIHGYGDHSHHLTLQIILDFCAEGFAVLAMDAIGHGISDGLHGYCENLDHLARDYHDYITRQRHREIFRDKPFFLYGQSMGGAIAFNICTKWDSSHVDGCILCAPMVNIAEDMLPPPLLINLANVLSKWLPLAPITPVPNIAARGFKVQSKYLESLKCNLNYRNKPRIITAVAMHSATVDISARLHQMKHPLLLLHGEADVVTCPDHTRLLYEKCSSQDKSIYIYPDALHSLMAGETDEQISAVRNDISAWIRRRI